MKIITRNEKNKREKTYIRYLSGKLSAKQACKILGMNKPTFFVYVCKFKKRILKDKLGQAEYQSIGTKVVMDFSELLKLI